MALSEGASGGSSFNVLNTERINLAVVIETGSPCSARRQFEIVIPALEASSSIVRFSLSRSRLTSPGRNWIVSATQGLLILLVNGRSHMSGVFAVRAAGIYR